MTALFRPIRSASGIAYATLAAVILFVFAEPFVGPFAAWAVS
ncbi:hypothetical protein [Sphingomonas alpina]|nr:hypothetical protein [Sphingomonas alpina]